MQKLRGEIFKNNKLIKKEEYPYKKNIDFFIALVTICEKMGVEIPLWTSKEDKMLDRENQVRINLDNKKILKISNV